MNYELKIRAFKTQNSKLITFFIPLVSPLSLVSPSPPLPFDTDMSDFHHSIDGFRSLVITSVITEVRGSIYYIDNGNRD
jgi:hypothetical protein